MAIIKRTEFMLGLIGGLVVFAAGILELIFGALWFSLFQKLGIYLGIWGIGCGIMIMLGAFSFRREEKTKAGILLMLIFGIAGVVTLQGWLVGPILAIVAAALALAKR